MCLLSWVSACLIVERTGSDASRCTEKNPGGWKEAQWNPTLCSSGQGKRTTVHHPCGFNMIAMKLKNPCRSCLVSHSCLYASRLWYKHYNKKALIYSLTSSKQSTWPGPRFVSSWATTRPPWVARWRFKFRNWSRKWQGCMEGGPSWASWPPCKTTSAFWR